MSAKEVLRKVAKERYNSWLDKAPKEIKADFSSDEALGEVIESVFIAGFVNGIKFFEKGIQDITTGKIK